MTSQASYHERREKIAKLSRDVRERVGFAACRAKAEAVPSEQGPRPEPETCRNAPAAAHAATFSQLYESADRRFCLYEDACGHLAAVNAARFA